MPNKYKLSDILGESLSREKALALIKSDWEAHSIFEQLPTANQEQLLSFIQGNQGLRIIHDRFAQHVLNPFSHPERLEHLLSAVLGQKVRIHNILAREGNQMVDAGSLVIMDFTVELSDGSFINVEIQQAGYAFPGQRAGCYLSDLIMRQYNLLKSQRGSQFTYRDMKPAVLIVFMEYSAKPFLDVAPQYIHREIHSFDSGASISNLTHTIYISLDTFHSVIQNISTELDAWLTFLSSDQPADIVKLVNAYPEFLPCYKDIMEFRRHPKELMTMYSEALAILDRNTEKYMIDEWKKEEAELKEKVETLRSSVDSLTDEVTSKSNEIATMSNEITVMNNEIAVMNNEIAAKDNEIAAKDNEIAELKRQLAALNP